MKILVTGSNGLLGQKLTDLLKDDESVDLIATSRGENRHATLESSRYRSIDLTDRDSVMQLIAEEKPDSIIHTAAMTNVDACELDPVNCELQNVTVVRYMIEAAKAVDAHLLHLSTDFIFDGEDGPYDIHDAPNPLSTYGRSKLDAEELIANSGLEKWAIARTIIVYGIVSDMSRSNVVLWAKGALEKGDPINVVNDQWRMPTLAEDLAKGCATIAKKQAQGIFHLSGKDLMSILELVERVGRYFDLDTSKMTPIASTDLGQPAKRPRYTGFVLDRSIKELGYTPVSFEEGLAILAAQMIA